MLTLQEFVAEKFGGRLLEGRHKPDSEACIFEAESQRRGIPWTDKPYVIGCLDIRPINDGPWTSGEQRARYLVPLFEVMAGSQEWSVARQAAFVARVLIETVRRIIVDQPGLSDELREQCRTVQTLDQAWSVTKAVAWSAGERDRAVTAAGIMATAAACTAARITLGLGPRYWFGFGSAAMTRFVSTAGVSEGADQVLIRACEIWREAALAGERA